MDDENVGLVEVRSNLKEERSIWAIGTMLAQLMNVGQLHERGAWDRCSVTHVGLYRGDQVCEAVFGGVRKIGFPEWLDEYDGRQGVRMYATPCREGKRDLCERAWKWAECQVGKPYDWFGGPQAVLDILERVAPALRRDGMSEERMCCSTLIGLAFLHALGGDDLSWCRGLDGPGPGELSPANIADWRLWDRDRRVVVVKPTPSWS